MAPVVAVMVPLYAIFRSVDLVGTLPGLILAYTTFNLPFAIWILKGFFDNVPYAIEEAQMCDGGTRLQAFRVILPLVAPGIGAFLVLCVLFAWNDFLFASIIGSRRRQDAAGRRRASWCSRRTSSGAASWRPAW